MAGSPLLHVFNAAMARAAVRVELGTRVGTGPSLSFSISLENQSLRGLACPLRGHVHVLSLPKPKLPRNRGWLLSFSHVLFKALNS